jgi:CO/xanthine dehydrogenase Mo-binding subunit
MVSGRRSDGSQANRTPIVGQSALRVEGREHVTGRTRFVDDRFVPDMLYVKAKLSPYPNARILSIDTSRAEKLPGVVAVITAKDVPHNYFGRFMEDHPVLAEGYVRHIGQPLAAVAAVDEDVATTAVKLIDVQLEQLKPLFDVREAMAPDAPEVHQGGNVIRYGERDYRAIRTGDVEQGFREADRIFEMRFSLPMREHVPLETQVSLAVPDWGGKVDIYSCTQSPFLNGAQVASILQKPLNQVRVISGTVGGGFGAKNDLSLDHITALLALKTGRPCKWLWTREEEFLNSSVDNPYPEVIYKTGIGNDGTITALYVTAIQDAGAFNIFSNVGLDKFGIYAPGPYLVPNYWFDGRAVFTNKPSSGALRGFNVGSAIFCAETNINRIADEMGLDPVDLRLKNVLKDGDVSSTQVPMEGTLDSAERTLLGALNAFGWQSQPARREMTPDRRSFVLGGRGSRRRGRGMAIGICGVGGSGGNDPSMAEVEMYPDGTVKVKAGAVDLGGGQKTILSQMAAEELGVPLEEVAIQLGDTETTPFSAGTRGNRETYISGNAVRMAAQELRALLCETAAGELGLASQDLVIQNGLIMAAGDPEQAVPLVDVARLTMFKLGRPLIGRGGYSPKSSWPDTITGRGKPTEQSTFGASVAEVEVDVDTGEARVTKLVCCHDAGKAINPAAVEGQMGGGAAQGIGMALMEDMLPLYPSVTPITTGLHAYKIPCAADMPDDITSVIVEVPAPKGPWGAKSFGETTGNHQAPAIIAAIHDAVGVWITDLPATPDKVLAAIKEQM